MRYICEKLSSLAQILSETHPLLTLWSPLLTLDQGGITPGPEQGELGAEIQYLGGKKEQKSGSSSLFTHPLRCRFYHHLP
jgi:hypothetical protein